MPLGPSTGGRLESPFEVMVGAVLVQNTNWNNVIKAIENLRQADLLEPHALAAVAAEELEELIRPAGYFRIKARRLHNLIAFLVDRYDGSLEAMFQTDPAGAPRGAAGGQWNRPRNGDSILLYAGNLPRFVVDTYTHRVLSRHGWIAFDADYHQLQQFFEDRLPGDAARIQRVPCGCWCGWARIIAASRVRAAPSALCESCCPKAEPWNRNDE